MATLNRFDNSTIETTRTKHSLLLVLISEKIHITNLQGETYMTEKNKLFFGDNLDIMRDHIPDESIDLIYLDPPFNSQATYNVLFGETNGTQSAAQITE